MIETIKRQVSPQYPFEDITWHLSYADVLKYIAESKRHLMGPHEKELRQAMAEIGLLAEEQPLSPAAGKTA